MVRTLVNNASLANPKNLLINSAMDFWQRGTSFTPTTTNYPYSADRWSVEYGGGAGGTVVAARDTSLPAMMQYGASLKMTASVASGASSLSAHQKIEAADIAQLIGKTVTASIWFRSVTASSTTAVRVIVPSGSTPDVWTSDPSSSDTIVTTNSSSVVGSWQRVSVSFVVPAAAANGIMISGVHSATGVIPLEVYFTGAMLTEGPSMPSDTYRQSDNLAIELTACQRYYETGFFHCSNYAPSNVALCQNTVPLKVTKRGVPVSLKIADGSLSNITTISFTSTAGDFNNIVCNVVATAVGWFRTQEARWSATAEL